MQNGDRWLDGAVGMLETTIGENPLPLFETLNAGWVEIAGRGNNVTLRHGGGPIRPGCGKRVKKH
jgi:hypothetical protein